MTAKIKSLARHDGNNYKNKPRGVSDSAFAKVYWPYLPVVLIAGVLLSMGAQAGALQAAVSKHHGKVLDYSTSMTLSALLADSNAARSQNGVGSLSLNSELDAAAQAQANDMAARNYWSHNTPEGSPPWVWVTAQGYSYQKLGQNLAAGFSDEQATVDGWMASPPHRENLLDPAFTDVGFGSANNPDYTSAGGGPMTIVVAFYGEPAQAAPAAPPASPAPPVTPASTSPTDSTPPASAASSAGASAGGSPAADTSTPKPNTETTAVKKSSPEVRAENTTNNHGLTFSYKTSRAQIALARLPASSFATTFAVIGIFAALGLWISQHLLTLRRVFVYGETFVIRHPLMDVGLLTIAAFSFMLSQTAGIIL